MTLPELLDLLRTKGVTHFAGTLDGTPVHVSFGPLEPKASPQRSLPFGPNDEMCSCGHATYGHNGGLCLYGCDPAKCIPLKEKK